ncbi:oxygen-independent coproporphyrinogen-3 oxidase [Peptoniphilus asaccharolyticus DSM 20463]|uniref:Heme chaperone HemW n=1 Tax=Peptoniphilus asaccharolyticus DSM 20463 TaxID=573058 RepID=A0A1W1UUQ5_PEPAS|nr:radical SAM family heme chaperone HemW [Peptoniphilus asaccharolyticus]MBL7575204.1 radical SAM family heme chaperone HemW [Peptoniphilus asaccharolyticus]SMB84803.1 oxygen-independent coproporphyrinogen-3 oxidase [Peptoniphilus asaccharolyticus DSM 20463]
MNTLNFKSQEFWDFLNTQGAEELSLYIHIPFCEQKCLYCDFYSEVSKSDTHSMYVDSLINELSEYKDYLSNKKIVSIFIGGGTPSAISPTLIRKFMNYLKSIAFLSEDCEITTESNPNSLSDNSIKTYIESGINRISMGAQSFNDKILKTIGRIHTADQIYKAIDLLQANDFKNFNLDLMLALPGQTISDIEKSIEIIKKYDVPHISYYSLILEEGTPLYKNMHLYNFPDEISDRKMYRFVVNELEKLGLKQYEISNFSKNNFECKHNLRYWKLKDYIGIGCSAQSNIGNIRYSNVTSLKNYLKNKNDYVFEKLNKIERLNEYNMLGLRLNSGIEIEDVNFKFNIDFEKEYHDVIIKNIENKLITLNNGIIKLTNHGKDLSNAVELDFTRIPCN